MEHKHQELKVAIEEEGIRLDVFLSKKTDLSRGFAQELIADGLVAVNQEKAKKNYKVKQNDWIVLTVPPPKELEARAEDIPLTVLYEDSDILIVDKPKGMVVHPAAGNVSGTLVNGLLKQCEGQLSDINGVIRPGIVHRIDKDTSGILVVAKNNKAHEALTTKFKNHDISREYIALVHGVLPTDKGKIDAPIGRDKNNRKKMAVLREGGRRAVTYFTVLERFQNYSLVRATLETGRTHQIRVHMAYIGFPIVGDATYGRKRCAFAEYGQFLHARLLGFSHPTTGKYMEFQSEIPQYFKDILGELE